MSDDLISVSEIASRHGRHKNSLFKVLKRLGIETQRLKSQESRGQAAAYISSEDYERLKVELVESTSSASDADESLDLPGYFYIIQLEPDLEPGRLKLGFASSVEERLRAHKTSAPFAKVLKCWPCKPLWEKTAIESITVGCERIHTEVFRAEEIGDVVARAENFFDLMPDLRNA